MLCLFWSLMTIAATASPSIAKLIPQVPDANQPPTNTLGVSYVTNYCAPMAAVNITEYWDVVMAHPNAVGVNAGLGVRTAAEYIGYFMDTNDNGDPTRANGTSQPSANGTYTMDQVPGFSDYVRWDEAFLFTTPPPALPAGKTGYSWKFDYVDVTMVSDSSGFEFCAAAIDSGLPIVIDFFYWNPWLNAYDWIDPGTGDTITFYDWGLPVSGSTDPNHEEEWNLYPGEEGIGHAVTGVGYFRNFDPDGGGSLPQDDYVVVHDNWSNTPKNVAVPWAHWNAVILADPNYGITLSETVDLSPYYDWGAISSYPGLAPPAGMGIWCPPHGKNLYFPSDTLAGSGGYPLAWMESGHYLATRYGPANVRLGSCPVGNTLVTVPDANSNACSLFVEVPPSFMIDQAGDLNVLLVTPGMIHTVSLDQPCIAAMAFLASADGWAEYAGGPSPDQPLEIRINYSDGTGDTLNFNNIHPAGRLDMIDPIYPPSWVFIYGNEVFTCDPGYFDLPSPYYDPAHSEAWHWYTVYPNPLKITQTVDFVGVQTGSYSDIYISALSYSRYCGGEVDVRPSGVTPAPPAVGFLSRNFPNPFNPATEIRFGIHQPGRVVLSIYDIAGRLVAVLAEGDYEAGEFVESWNGRDEAGQEVGSGVYFARLRVGDFTAMRKMVLLR